MTAMMTEVCSLRDMGDPEDRDVRCTRPGKWSNRFSVARYGMARGKSYIGKSALDRYREDLASKVAGALADPRQGRGAWLQELKALAGARLLCACTAEAIRQGACHIVPLAQMVQQLTGVPVKYPEPKED